MIKENNYDAEFCGNLAIHQTNSIQDYGYLLVLDISSLDIVQGSENIDGILATKIKDLVGHNLSAILSVSDMERIKTEISKGPRNRIPFPCSIDRNGTILMLDILLHIKENMVILEIERNDEQLERSFSDVFQEVRSFISIIERTESLEEICLASIHEIRKLANFDGIRMYRFDREWNGTVIAEEIEGDLESYLDQTFPASDVPKQARALYIKNPYRLIPNRAYKASKLFPVINPITNAFLDLSDCNLRSVSGVHLEYMANMNVTASMSIRVMVDGILWGLISCHHITAKYLSIELRSIFEWLSMEISYRISSVIKQEALTTSAKMLKIQAAITENVFTKGGIREGLMQDENKNLQLLFNTTGFAISLGGKISSGGLIPNKEDLENLFLWIEGKVFGSVFSSHELGKIYDEAQSYPELASGILVIPIDANKGDFIICFRPEVIKNIKWGGDPNHVISFEKDGIGYHPRNSFKLWLQTVHGQSEAWSDIELDTAESLRKFLVDFHAAQP